MLWLVTSVLSEKLPQQVNITPLLAGSSVSQVMTNRGPLVFAEDTLEITGGVVSLALVPAETSCASDPAVPASSVTVNVTLYDPDAE